jgi:hypothetical protein
MYLIYDELTDAEQRADEEGQYRGYSFWLNGIGTKWLTSPVQTAEGDYALEVSGYNLNEVEYDALHETITLPEPELVDV